MGTKQHTTKNQWVIEEIKKESIKINDNKNTAFQNLWDIAKAVLREILTAIQAYLKKQEKFQINNIAF